MKCYSDGLFHKICLILILKYMYITIVLFFLVNIYSSDNSEMEYCNDSPVKKKIRKSVKKANESSRQCIIHVCDGGNEMVSHFSENSWNAVMLVCCYFF